MVTYFFDGSAIVKRYFPVIADLYTSTGDLCRSHRISAYDAAQLACTLALREYTLTHQVSKLILFYTDVELLDIAGVEGLQVENPSNYL